MSQDKTKKPQKTAQQISKMPLRACTAPGRIAIQTQSSLLIGKESEGRSEGQRAVLDRAWCYLCRMSKSVVTSRI